MTMEHAAFMGRRLISEKSPGTSVTRGKSPVTLLITQNFLRVSRATGFLGGLMGSTAATCRRVGIRLLSECERGGSERNSDCKA